MRKARVRTRQDSWHPVILTVSLAAIGLSLYGYWRLAQDALAPPPPPPGSRAEASPALKAARAELRRAYLDPLSHLRLAEALYRDGRIVDSFFVLDGARGFFGEARFAWAHGEVILESDPRGVQPTPSGPAWASQEASDFERQARAAASRAEFDVALKRVEAGLIVTPQEPRLSALKALLLSKFLERPADAVPLYRMIALTDPAAPAGRLAVEHLGRRAHFAAVQRGPDGARSGDPSGTQAIETLEELARRHPDDPRIFQNLAMLRWTEGKLDAVREMSKAALARNPRHAGALSMSGALALNDQDADGAIRFLEEALKEQPSDLYAALKLAELRQQYKADRRSALPLWIAVHRLDPWRETQGRPIAEMVRETVAFIGSEALKGATLAETEEFLGAPDAGLRAEAAAAVGRRRDLRLVGALGELLDDDAELVRRSADEALFAIGRGSATPEFQTVVLGWLDSDRPLVRARALNLAADLYPNETRPRALAVLRDADPALRLVARMTLQHYYATDREAAAAVQRSDFEETSELFWALLKSRGIPRPGAPPPAAAAEPEPDPTPAPAPAAKPKPVPPAVLAAQARRRGGAALKAGRLADAAAAFEKADRLEGGDPDTLLDLARTYSRLRDGSKSAAALRRCLAAARALGAKPLEKYRRLAKSDDQLSYLQAQPRFAVLLKPFEE